MLVTVRIRLPAETCFLDLVKLVNSVVGKNQMLFPVGSTWDSFFTAEVSDPDDLMENLGVVGQ